MEIKIKRLRNLEEIPSSESVWVRWRYICLQRLSDIPYQRNDRPNDRMRWENFCKEGVLNLLYESGELRAEISCKDYRRHGVSIWYYESGIMEAEIFYENDWRYGKAYWFSKIGRLKAEVWHFRGIEVADELYHRLRDGNLSIKEILDVKNAAVRDILMKEVNAERLFEEVPNMVLDKVGEEMLVQLKTDWMPMNILKVRCPSTGRYHFLRVSQETKSIRESKAWTFGLTEKEYAPVKET